ncbi:MAG: hypothetical protein K2I97_04205, partial [Alistipes sp.]|nr:hypothetical protein [Alistipes sp.]
MAWENIRKELAQLSVLVEGWCDGKPVDTLERDLALVKLRNLYEAIRFSESTAEAVAAQPKNIEVESLAVAMPEDSDAETLDLSGMLGLEPDLAPVAPDEFAAPAIPPTSAEPEELVLPARRRKKPQPAASASVSPQEPEPIVAPVATFVPQQKPEANPNAAVSNPERFVAPDVEVLAKPRT